MLKPQYNPFRSARKGRLSFATSGNKTVDLITLESADPLERNRDWQRTVQIELSPELQCLVTNEPRTATKCRTRLLTIRIEEFIVIL
jgi:hypothetical protein